MRRVPRHGFDAEILRAFTEATCLKSRRPIDIRESRTGRPTAFRCQKAKSCAIVSRDENVQAQSWGRATGFGGIRGDAAACPSRFCDRKPLIWACHLAADWFVGLLSDRCHGRYVSSRYGIKNVTACVADVVCRVLCCPYQTNGLLAVCKIYRQPRKADGASGYYERLANGSLKGGLMADQADGNLASKGKRGKLTNSQLRLLGFIAACGPDGCSETKQELARNLQISLKTVDRAIHRLREEGLIVSHARFGEDGTQLSNTYIAAAMDGEGDCQDSQSEQE